VFIKFKEAFFEQLKGLMLMNRKIVINIASFLSFFILLAAGCAISNKPLFIKYDADGKPVMEKRYRRFMARDFQTRWNAKAYNKNNTSGPHFLLSKEQKDIKKKFGPPDYISPSYLSSRGDYAIEWLYFEKGVMFQFVNRRLAYEGPLSDKERILVAYGYPDEGRMYIMGEIIRENFYYYTLFGIAQKSFNFVNGKLAVETIFQ